MTKEEKMLEFMEILKNPDKIVRDYGDDLEFWKDDKIYFWYRQRSNILYCAQPVWSVLQEEYSLNYNQIRRLIRMK